MSSEFQLRLGAVLPNLPLKTTKGNFTLHEFLDSDPTCPWTLLMSHPSDFTPVCTTEMTLANELVPEFKKQGVKLIEVSCDTLESHKGWEKDVGSLLKCPKDTLDFPIIEDESREFVTKLGMLDPQELTKEGIPLPARALIVIGKSHEVKLAVLYPASCGRDYHETLRTVKSLRLTQDHLCATPVDWKEGERVCVLPFVTNEQAKEKFENFEIVNLPSGKEYLRKVDCPKMN